MKQDEIWFFKEVCTYGTNHGRVKELEDVFQTVLIPFLGGKAYTTKYHLSPREILNMNQHRIDYKRGLYLLSKWDKNGWYESGVSEDLGWITEKGNKVYLDMIKDNADHF